MDSIRLLSFAPAAQNRRRQRSTGFGRKFINVRFRIVKNNVFNCSRDDFIDDTLSRNRAQDVPRAGSSLSSRTSVSAQPSKTSPLRRPLWVKKGFITRRSMEYVRREVFMQENGDGIGSISAEEIVGNGNTEPAMKRRRSKKERENKDS